MRNCGPRPPVMLISLLSLPLQKGENTPSKVPQDLNINIYCLLCEFLCQSISLHFFIFSSSIQLLNPYPVATTKYTGKDRTEPLPQV